MGLFSKLFGGGKKAGVVRAEAPAPTPAQAVKTTVMGRQLSVPAAPPAAATASGTGVVQVRLRLKLAASLRAGEDEAAYQAAKGLADMQAKAGRRTGARIWRVEAERILARLESAA
jgi:hypothetical protein